MALNCFSVFTKHQSIKIGRLLARHHTMKTITGDTIVELNDSTLLGRIMTYLDSQVNMKSIPKDSKIIRSLVYGNSSVLRSLTVDQLTGLFYIANTNVMSYNKSNMIKVLDLLDVECCLRINGMDSASILKLLNAYMHVIPNRITTYKFYQYATDNFDRYLKEATKKDLLQFIFYIGLIKNSSKSKLMLQKCLRLIDKSMLQSLSVEDLCIICNSTYRTNTKLSNKKILDKLKETLNNNLYLLKDPALLVTLLKTIKHNRFQDDDILSTIKCTIFFNKTSQYYTFASMCHILSLYTDYLYYEEDLLNLFVDKCITDLRNSGDLAKKQTYLTEQIRPKDITRFLWILSILGFNIDKGLLESVIVPNIQKRLNAGLYNNHPEELADSVLYLYMLGVPASGLIQTVLTPTNIMQIKGTQSKNRLNLLLALVKHEDEQLFNDLKVRLELSNYYHQSQVELRPHLKRVLKALKSISGDLKVDSFQMHMQIPHLNIMGISAFRECAGATKPKQIVNIEILDEFNCVKNIDCLPSGYMKLKLRILEKLAVPLITIPQSDIEKLTDEELITYLKDEFQLIIY